MVKRRVSWAIYIFNGADGPEYSERQMVSSSYPTLRHPSVYRVYRAMLKSKWQVRDLFCANLGSAAQAKPTFLHVTDEEDYNNIINTFFGPAKAKDSVATFKKII